MSTFQIVISPPVRKTVSQKPDKFEEAIPRLFLAPFVCTPEIKFGEVFLNSVVSKNLLVFNSSTSSSISIQFSNIDAEDRIFVSEPILLLKAHEEKQISISWSPIHSGYLRKIIRAQDIARKARSFDVVLSGMAVNKVTENAKKKKAKLESKKTTFSNPKFTFDSTITLTQSSNQQMNDFRRQTYTIEEKENRLPTNYSVSKNTFKASSPKNDFSNWSVLHENSAMKSSRNIFNSYDTVDAPTKYSNFESELDSSNFLNSHLSDETNPMDIRRSTFSMDFVPEPEENVVLSPLKNVYLSESLEDNSSSSLAENITFNLNSCEENVKFEENVFLTPQKNFNLDSILISPPQNLANVPSSISKSSNYLCSINQSSDNNCSSKSGQKDELFFISPPNKFYKRLQKSPETFIHRTGSSAIKDRKKHLRTSFMSKRRTPPSSTKKLQGPCKRHTILDENSVEKIRVQNPQALKQAVSSQCLIEDPFLKQVLYNDDRWMDEQEKDIIKWINSVLVPPVELDEENPNYTVDAAEVWLKRNRTSYDSSVWSVNKVPVSLYNAPERVALLRKRSKALRDSELVKSVFHDLRCLISKKTIYIRDGRDIYADEGIKNKLLQLLACYNPLWLRIGLETVYNREIALQPKADIGGLGLFIRKTVLVSSNINKKTANQKEEIRKNILLKFFQLIFFMDQARIHKLFRHNRCLFTLNSSFKSSQDLLDAFCRDLVTGRSYIGKILKNIGYVLQFKQTCVDEYNYTITNLKDLNDGVRLTRLFEILFAEPDLCSKLRVPAIDIENKKYNVDVAIKAAKRKCVIEGKITAEDFVLASRVGSRIKILSFLWQVINNYLTPLYEKAALKIQRWWRIHFIKINKERLATQKREHSAIIIQAAWKSYITKKKFHLLLCELKNRNAAAVIIQRRIRAFLAIKHYQETFHRISAAARTIQSWFRSRVQRKRFLYVKQKVLIIQQRYRAYKKMKECRDQFMSLKKSCVIIQQRYRAAIAMRIERKHYLLLKRAVITVQQRYRSRKIMKECRKRFLRLKLNSIYIQQLYRANVAMKCERNYYIRLKLAAITLQTKYKGKKEMERRRDWFERLKKSCVLIQQRYRATIAMRKQRNEYLSLKKAAVVIQHRYRIIRLTKKCRCQFESLKKAAIIIQRRYRANAIMRTERNEFIVLRQAAVLIQRKFRYTKLTKEYRNAFEKLKKASIVFQRRYRANLAMRSERNNFIALKQAIVAVQRRYRSIQFMKKCQNYFKKLKKSTVVIQRRYRANIAMRVDRNQFLTLRQASIIVQRWYRNNKLMRKYRDYFRKQRKSTLFIQRRFRANTAMRIQRNHYTLFKQAVLIIQKRYRSIMLMRDCCKQFEKLKKVTIIIQQRYRAKVAMRVKRTQYLLLRQTAIFIQRSYRNKKFAKVCQIQYEKLKSASVVIQQRYRANVAMKVQRSRFKSLRQAAISVQRWYRASRIMRECKASYLNIKRCTIFIQRRWRMKIIRRQLLRKRTAAIRLQKWWRTIHTKPVLQPIYNPEDAAAVKIQALWRGYRTRKKCVVPKNVTLVTNKKEKENPDLKSTLGERYKKAIYELKTSDLYSVITIALWNLERVTTFSAKLCEGVVAEGIVPIIFSLIARGNRSVPALVLYRASIGILINLTLYERTKVILWKNMSKIEDISLILHLMKITHNQFLRKDEIEVFRYSATFLWLLCQDKSISEFIANIPGFPLHLNKMKETLQRTCPCTKKRELKRVARILPNTQAKWYADPKTRTFDDNCFALLSLIRILYIN